MTTTETIKQIVNLWMDYIYHFGSSELGLSKLIQQNLCLEDVKLLLENAVHNNQEITPEMLDAFKNRTRYPTVSLHSDRFQEI